MRAHVAWIVLAALAVTARADPGAGVALDHLDRGVAAYRAGDFAAAHRELELARELAPDHANPYRWLARTEVQLGNCRAALVDVERFLSRVRTSDPRAPEMVKLRERCVLELHAGGPPPPSGLVSQVPAPAPAPLTHRWWFWGALGLVAVSAVGVTYAVVHDGGPAELPPVTCGATGCRP